MGKIKHPADFSPQLIEEWEASDCVNFAVGLARLTGWLLEVDWWSPATDRNEEVALERLKPIRVHVADNGDKIFDARGIRSLVDYKKAILDRRLGEGSGGVDTHFYEEARLSSLPLRSQPNETMIARAIAAIQANSHYIDAIPKRTQPCIPAYEAARFTLGQCAPFAEAMQGVTGLQPAALLATRFSPLFGLSQTSESGYIHSVVLHPDGMAEDAWGKASLKDIASRFGASEFQVSIEEHYAVVRTLRQNSSDLYERVLQDALGLIEVYRHSQ